MDKKTAQFPQVPGYEIKKVLGTGGMATVYLAVQSSLSRPVALKIMDRALVADADFRRRFLKEGRLIAQLYHPNIVSVYDIGTSGDVHYLSMPYFSGGTLDQRLKKELDPEFATKILKSLASALGYAHEHGIIHRDIKPGNVLFTNAGDPILTDFGIAKTLGNETVLTTAGMTVGSIQYMSPEQAQGRTLDNRSDLYSLGVLFWQMLMGSLPYQASDFFTLAIQHAKDPIPALPEHLLRFQPIIETLLAKMPENRYASSDELLETLKEIPSGDTEPMRPLDNDETLILNTPSPLVPGRQALEEIRIKESGAFGRRPTKTAMYAAILGIAGIIGYYGYVHLFPATQETAPQETSVESGDQYPGATKDLPSHQSLHPEERGAQGAPAAKIPGKAAPRSSEAKGPSLVDRLRQEAEQHWQAGRLTEPSDANAFKTYSRILELDPEHVEAKQRLVGIGRINVANKMFLSAERLLRSGEIDDARQMIETGLKINPDDDRLLGLRRALE